MSYWVHARENLQAALKAGDKMKDYPNYYKVLKNQDNKSVTLSGFQGKSPVVLFFYPKAGTPGCTKEACSFRDKFEKFSKAGAQVCTLCPSNICSRYIAPYRGESMCSYCLKSLPFTRLQMNMDHSPWITALHVALRVQSCLIITWFSVTLFLDKYLEMYFRISHHSKAPVSTNIPSIRKRARLLARAPEMLALATARTIITSKSWWAVGMISFTSSFRFFARSVLL